MNPVTTDPAAAQTLLAVSRLDRPAPREGAAAQNMDVEREILIPVPARPDLVTVVEMLNRALDEGAREVRFALDDSSGRAVVRVVRSDTGEVLRQIPSETVLAMAALLERGEAPASLGVELWT